MVCLAVAAFPGIVVVPCAYIPSRRSNHATTSSTWWADMGSSVVGSWADMLVLANKFNMMSIALVAAAVVLGQKCPRTTTPYMWKTALPLSRPCQIWYLGVYGQTRVPPQAPALGTSSSSSMSRRGCTKEHFISEADMETINKDNRLKDLVKTDPKRVKKYVRSRISNTSCSILQWPSIWVIYLSKCSTFSFCLWCS
jgi:hypothetical protein